MWYFSTRISEIGLAARPSFAVRTNWSRSFAIPVPSPPMMKLGRIMIGKPILVAVAIACSSVRAKPASGVLSPISPIASRNFSRSSAVAIASGLAPITSTP